MYCYLLYQIYVFIWSLEVLLFRTLFRCKWPKPGSAKQVKGKLVERNEGILKPEENLAAKQGNAAGTWELMESQTKDLRTPSGAFCMGPLLHYIRWRHSYVTAWLLGGGVCVQETSLPLAPQPHSAGSVLEQILWLCGGHTAAASRCQASCTHLSVYEVAAVMFTIVYIVRLRCGEVRNPDSSPRAGQWQS